MKRLSGSGVMPLSEPLKEGKVVLNQEKKDKKISKILFILTSFFSWFKTIPSLHPSFPASRQKPALLQF